MKFASLLIDMNFIGQADPQNAQRKKSIATRYFWVLNARRACFLLFSVLSTENHKIYQLWVFCDSNERSEWAVKRKKYK